MSRSRSPSRDKTIVGVRFWRIAVVRDEREKEKTEERERDDVAFWLRATGAGASGTEYSKGIAHCDCNRHTAHAADSPWKPRRIASHRTLAAPMRTAVYGEMQHSMFSQTQQGRVMPLAIYQET